MQRNALLTGIAFATLLFAAAQAQVADVVVYETGFEPPQFENGRHLAAFDGWVAYSDQNVAAASIATGAARTGVQCVVIDGNAMSRYLDRDYYAGFYFRPVEYDPVAAGERVVDFSVDARYVPGDEGEDSRAQVELYDSGGTFIGAFSVDGAGQVLGWTDLTPATATTCDGAGWNNFGVEVDYVTRSVRFRVNGRLFGAAPLDPAVTDFFEADLSLVTNIERSTHRVYYDSYRVVARGTPGLPEVQIQDQRRLQDGFELTFSTVPGFSYAVEVSESLAATAWSSLPLEKAGGSEMTVKHADPPAGAAFYRVRVE